MNKISTLVLGLIFSFSSVLAQKIDYDHTSKWFFGLNAGATWQTTDVRNQFNAGYGFTLGKSFNFDYGKVLSFDLRFRYLRGKWYGQDTDTSSLSSYNPDNISSDAYPLQQYKDSFGYAVNNFQADVHRIALELAIHANRLRERTGWDPYIFGGIGITWSQTYGDLYLQDGSNAIYDYSNPSQINSSYLNTIKDGIYDTPLTGSSTKFKANFMPSLGFGLGYQVGKRVTLGLEHKTTFTLKDDFDGVLASSPRKNDLYHYTSLYLEFRFRTNYRDHVVNEDTTVANCPTPKIYFRSPSNVSSVSNQQIYNVVADLHNVLSRDQIIFMVNNTPSTNFNFNTSTKRFESTVVLVPGNNQIEIAVRTNCGETSQPVAVVYEPCIPASISLMNPSVINSSVTNANYTVQLQINGGNQQQSIKFTQNGKQINNYTINNNILSANVVLENGANNFQVEVTNNCGTSTQTFVIQYNRCLQPSINFTSPNSNNSTVTSQNYTLSAIVQNVVNTQNITLTQNGNKLSNFSFSNATIQKNVVLTNGVNVFEITATNECGKVSQSVIIQYQPCTPPSISITNPNASNTTVTSSNFVLLASVQNFDINQVSISQNGQNIGNGTSQNNLLRKDVTLKSGANVFVLTANNSCGTSTQTVSVFYNDCVPPTIGMINPSNNNTSVSTATIDFMAQVNHTNLQGITLSQNGKTITGSSFNNNILKKNVSLNPGTNVFIVTATNTCGTTTETITINYNNCVAPLVSWINPTNGSNTTVNEASYALTAQVQNVTANQVTITQNGQTLSTSSINNTILRKDVTLTPGTNIFVITASNTCGTVTQTVSINYNNCIPPSFSWITPSNGNNITISQANYTISANVSNVNSSQISVIHKGRLLTGTNYNNGIFSQNVSLNPGENIFVITITNECGSITETVTITYNNCVPPTIGWTNPTSNNQTVTNASYQLNAQINNTVQQNVTLTQNGQTLNGFTLNGTNFSKDVTLVPGVNVFTLKATNACGTATEVITINYNNCVAPTFQWLNPANGANTTVTNNGYVLTAQIENATQAQITMTQNGQPVTNFNYEDGILKTRLTLTSGNNLVTITVTNACGTITQTTTINYNDCIAPTLTWLSPSTSNSTVMIAAYMMKFQVNNAVLQNVSIKQNGQTISGFTMENGVISLPANLVAGSNQFEVTVTNACGQITSSTTINYQECNLPTITWINPSNVNNITVSNASYSFAAQIGDVSLANASATINGQTVNGMSLVSGILRGTVQLIPGNNVIVVTLTNNCGTSTFTINVTYENCQPPAITGLSPVQNGQNMTEPTVTIHVQISNITSAQAIVLTQNGQALNNFSFNNGTLTVTVNLVQGSNIFSIIANNSCGVLNEMLTLNYKVAEQGNGSVNPGGTGNGDGLNGVGNVGNGNTNGSNGNVNPTNPNLNNGNGTINNNTKPIPNKTPTPKTPTTPKAPTPKTPTNTTPKTPTTKTPVKQATDQKQDTLKIEAPKGTINNTKGTTNTRP